MVLEIRGSPHGMILKSGRERVGHLFSGTTAHPATEAVVMSLAIEGSMAKAKIPFGIRVVLKSEYHWTLDD